MPERPALVLIDLQNDFLLPTGALASKHIPAEPLLSNIRQAAKTFRESGYPVFWIRSEYGDARYTGARHLARPDGAKYADVPMNVDEHLASTHKGRALCRPNTHGAHFPEAIQDAIDPERDHVLTKRWFSAFTETPLHASLQRSHTRELYVAGVTAATCVRASVADAFFLGYSVRLLPECIGATSDDGRQRALELMFQWYAARADTPLGLPAAVPADPAPKLKVYWVNGSIPSWRVLLALEEKGVPYTRHRLKVMSVPKETRSAEFAAINPRCKTPTVVDVDGTIVIESLAILQYLETCYPTSRKLVPDPVASKTEYARCVQRMQESENLHNVFEPIEYLFKPEAVWKIHERDIAEAYHSTLAELQFWETYLGQHAFVPGDEFTLADCAFYPNLAYLVYRGFDLRIKGLVKLEAYYEMIGKRASAVQARPRGWFTVGRENLWRKCEKTVLGVKLCAYTCTGTSA